MSKQDKVTLATLWRKHSELWDVHHEYYHDRDKKELALAIAGQMEVPVALVKMKMHTLRTQYANERRKENAYVPTGTGGSKRKKRCDR